MNQAALHNFKFTVQTGSVSVFFYPQLTVPPVPSTGGIYIVDNNTKPILEGSIGFDPTVPLVVIPAGESQKNLNNIELILSSALKAGLARDSLFIGIGGGVITDMTAFAASVYMRGACLHLVPTTLLAMADAAIGGKTGVDFENYKNCVGTFYPAEEIHISINALQTLPQTEYLSGLAEVIKTAMLYSPDLITLLREKRSQILSRDPKLLLEIVSICAQAKAHVVERDLKEAGERMHLNLGHTFAHALETVAGFGTVSHGEAVAWGIIRALELGYKIGLTSLEWKIEATELIVSYGYPIGPIHPSLNNMDPTEQANLMLQAMKNDKKKRLGKVKFILQKTITQNLITAVSDDTVLEVLK